MASDPKAQMLDTLFGTRYHTRGAALQLPRKVPMRVEPKSYFGEGQGVDAVGSVRHTAAFRSTRPHDNVLFCSTGQLLQWWCNRPIGWQLQKPTLNQHAEGWGLGSICVVAECRPAAFVLSLCYGCSRLLCCAANERTFLSWCSMATTMGGVSSAMVGLSISAAGSSEGRLISRKTVDLVSAVYVPVAIIMILYALFTYEWRSRFMHKKQVGGRGGGVEGECVGGGVTGLWGLVPSVCCLVPSSVHGSAASGGGVTNAGKQRGDMNGGKGDSAEQEQGGGAGHVSDPGAKAAECASGLLGVNMGSFAGRHLLLSMDLQPW